MPIDLEEHCPWCGEWTHYVMIRSHYECPRCRRPVADCCDGEQNVSRETNEEDIG
jgi:hypothetical protein